jgi:hypothetical protein
MAGLTTIVRQEVEKYAGNGRGYQLRLYSISDELKQRYTVVSVDTSPKQRGSAIVVLARVSGNMVIIEHDTTNKPLLNALIQQGIPRQQIVLAYQGEPVPVLTDVL